MTHTVIGSLSFAEQHVEIQKRKIGWSMFLVPF